MTEYWKSNPRKFCDFCKCWIADNKPSVEFHERGKKHKENVEKKLDVIAKKGKEDHKNKLKEDDYMKAMEQAALLAYKKDLQSNPDMTGKKITEMAKATNAEIIIGSQEANIGTKKTEMKKELKWHIAKTPDGSSYYWHIETGESVWEAPKDGFVTLSEQKRMEKKASDKQQKSLNKQQKSSIGSKPHLNKAKPDLKHMKKKPIVQPKPSPPIKYGPENRGQPYGTWKTAFEPPEEVIDLQLPALPEQEYVLPEFVIKRPKITFAEKEVTLDNVTSTTSGPVFFKKRKGADEHKKNVRRRIDD